MWVKMNQSDINDFKKKVHHKGELSSFLFVFLVSILFMAAVCFVYIKYNGFNLSGSAIFFGIMILIGIVNCAKSTHRFMSCRKCIVKDDMFMCEAAVTFVGSKSSTDKDGDIHHSHYLAVQLEDSSNNMNRYEIDISFEDKERIKDGDLVRIVKFGTDDNNLMFYKKV